MKRDEQGRLRKIKAGMIGGGSAMLLPLPLAALADDPTTVAALIICSSVGSMTATAATAALRRLALEPDVPDGEPQADAGPAA